MNLRDQLIQFEGFRTRAYPDPLSGGAPYTIGVGHTGPEVKKNTVWDEKRCYDALDADILFFKTMVFNTLPWVADLNEPRQAVLIGMAFQMGLAGLLKFERTLKFIKAGDFVTAADNIRHSLWASQTPKRAGKLAQQLRTGVWQ